MVGLVPVQIFEAVHKRVGIRPDFKGLQRLRNHAVITVYLAEIKGKILNRLAVKLFSEFFHFGRVEIRKSFFQLTVHL